MAKTVALGSIEALAMAARGEVSGVDDVGAVDWDDDDTSGISDDGVEGIDDDGVEGVDDDDDETSGLGDYYQDVGARRKRRRVRKAKKPVWKGRRVLPFESVSIAAGAVETIVARPNHVFRMQRLVATGTGLVITNVFVQGESQFEGAGEVPIELFAGGANDVNFLFRTSPRNSEISIQVSNPTGAPITFTGAALGLIR